MHWLRLLLPLRLPLLLLPLLLRQQLLLLLLLLLLLPPLLLLYMIRHVRVRVLGVMELVR
jgi:hypothetical protein